jgi:hypothetical protein
MRRHWLALILALSLHAAPARAAEPGEEAAPAAVERIVDGSVLLPATGFHPEADALPFPLHSPDPTPPSPPGSVLLYGGGFLLAPSFQTDPAFVRTSAGTTRQVDFTRNMDYAPLAGLGFTTCSNWGMRARWFDFDESASIAAVSAAGETLAPVSPAPLGIVPQAGSLAARTDLDLTSVDVEGTYLVRGGQWSLLMGAGVRYVHISQDYAARLIAANGTTLAGSGHNFNGAGPTFSADGRLPLRTGRFALYSNLRFSALFGDDRETYYAQAPTGVITNRAQSSMDVLPIGELEVGAEYSWFARHCRFFVQAGFMGQVWWGAGNSSNIDPIAGTTAAGSNFGLYGLALRGGFEF